MSKYSKDLDQNLVAKIQNEAASRGLDHVMEIKPISLLKTNNEIGQILKAGELTTLFTGNPDIICVALYEEAFKRVDDETQNMWIETLMSQLSYDFEKDKIVITKPEINIPIGVYRKYGNTAAQKLEAALLVIDQIKEEEDAAKAAAKEAKKAAKKKK
jgi:hypothetical protein